MAVSKVSRREFIRLAGVAGGAAILTACGPQATPQVVTQVVKETQLVKETQVVNQTQVVEVTPTPPPAIVTPQGRELPPDAAPLDKQVFIGAGSEPKFFDPAHDIYSSAGQNTGTEPLLHYDENFELVPALAESWSPGPNAEYWEFVIRDGAVWSDGTPLTADDIVYTYQHLANPVLANPFVYFWFDIKGILAYNQGTGTAEDIGVEKVDDRTVRIYGQNGSIPYLPALMSYQAAVTVPKHKAEKDPEHWADTIENYVSYGPYVPTVWEHNKQIIWEVNPTYTGFHKPGIQKGITLIVAAGADNFAPFQNKETYMIQQLSVAQLSAARADPKLNPLVHFFSNFESRYMALNTFQPPLDNLDFRKALAHAIDRDVLAQQVFAGTEVAGYSMLPPGFPAYNPDLKELQVFDLAQAQSHLAASGVDPAATTLEVFSNGVDLYIQFVAQQWETNLGLKVKVTQLDGGTWGQMRADHTMQIFRGQYEYDFIDPSNMLTGLWRSIPAPEGKQEPFGSPRHNWKNEEFDKLVTDAGVEADAAKRIQMFQDAERLLVEDVGAVFILHQVIFQIWWPWVVGIHPDKTGNVVFRWLDISANQMYIHKDVDAMMAAA